MNNEPRCVPSDLQDDWRGFALNADLMEESKQVAKVTERHPKKINWGPFHTHPTICLLHIEDIVVQFESRQRTCPHATCRTLST